MVQRLQVCSPDLLNDLSCFSDNICAGETHYACHLHRVPPSTEEGGRGEGGRESEGEREGGGISALSTDMQQDGAWEWDLPLPHDVSVERVEDALVSQLE